MSLSISAAIFTLALGLISLTNKKIWIIILTVLAVGIQIVLIIKDDLDPKKEQSISNTNRDVIIHEIQENQAALRHISDMLRAKKSVPNPETTAPIQEPNDD